MGQPKYTHLPKWGKRLSHPSYLSSCTEHPRAAANTSPRNRPTPETLTLRQALPEQTRPREGNPILVQDTRYQFRYSTSYSMNLTHCSKTLVLNQWPQHRYLKEWAKRGPKLACIYLTLDWTDLHLKMALGRVPSPINGIIGGPRRQWYSDTYLS